MQPGIEVARGYWWHAPSDCARCGYPEGYHYWEAWKGEMGHVGQEAWEARSSRHDYEAPTDQMRKERIKAAKIMRDLDKRGK